MTGVWGSLSKVTGELDTSIVTQDSTALLDDHAQPVPGQTPPGAMTIELTDAERAQANNSNLWVQGGTPTDPVLAQKFPGPEYGFGTLRCATDNLNGDNVEFVYFPAGVIHVFCFAYYVKPPPTTGLITIQKRVTGAPAGPAAAFPFTGDLSFNPGGFQLSDGGSIDFYRAGGTAWSVTEGAVDGYKLDSIKCTATTLSGGPGRSTFTISETTPTVTIHLVALEHVTCVYTNSHVPPTGSLTIIKVTHGGVGTFAYRVTPASGQGPVHHTRATTTEPNVPVDAKPSLGTLAPGTYRIREGTPVSTAGRWRLLSVVCDGTKISRPPILVTIAIGKQSTCVFTNLFIPRGSISLAKITKGATGRASFLVEPVRDRSRNIFRPRPRPRKAWRPTRSRKRRQMPPITCGSGPSALSSSHP